MTSEFHPGSLIDGYVLDSYLGGGGFGKVWRGHNPRTGEQVAIKFLTGNFSSADTARVRAEIELLAGAAGRESPHVVRVLGSGYNEAHYIVLEFIEGEDLEALIRRQSALSTQRTIEVGLAVCSALEALNHYGIVHRDIKPANVMIDRGGVVKLADFGIAKIMGYESVTMTGHTPMTLAYAAPEMWDDDSAFGVPSHRTDLYALGVLLYESLTGVTPFRGNYGALYKAHTQIAPDLTALPKATPASLRTLLQRCLAKRQTERPATAADCTQFLRRAEVERREAEGVLAVGEPRHFGPWLRIAPHETQPFAWHCRHETARQTATVEIHFTEDLDDGRRLRLANEVNAGLVAHGAERFFGTNRLLLTPGQQWEVQPPGRFQFWLAREDRPVLPAAVVSLPQLMSAATSIEAMFDQAKAHDVALSLKDRLILTGDRGLYLERPGLAPWPAGEDSAAEALDYLAGLPLDSDCERLLRRAPTFEALLAEVRALANDAGRSGPGANTVAADTVVLCPVCDSAMRPDDAFCSKCGYRIGTPVPSPGTTIDPAETSPLQSDVTMTAGAAHIPTLDAPVSVAPTAGLAEHLDSGAESAPLPLEALPATSLKPESAAETLASPAEVAAVVLADTLAAPIDATLPTVAETHPAPFDAPSPSADTRHPTEPPDAPSATLPETFPVQADVEPGPVASSVPIAASPQPEPETLTPAIDLPPAVIAGPSPPSPAEPAPAPAPAPVPAPHAPAEPPTPVAAPSERSEHPVPVAVLGMPVAVSLSRVRAGSSLSEYELSLASAARLPLRLRLSAAEGESSLAFSMPETLTLLPNQPQRIAVNVTARSPRRFGAKKLTPFALAVAADGGSQGPPVTAHAVFEETPPASPLLAGAGVLGVAVVALLAGVFLMNGGGSDDESLALAGTTPTPAADVAPAPTPQVLTPVVPTPVPAVVAPPVAPAPVEAPPVDPPAPPPPNRMDCNAIRGTAYQSDAERLWFQANCPATAPATASGSAVRTPTASARAPAARTYAMNRVLGSNSLGLQATVTSIQYEANGRLTVNVAVRNTSSSNVNFICTTGSSSSGSQPGSTITFHSNLCTDNPNFKPITLKYTETTQDYYRYNTTGLTSDTPISLRVGGWGTLDNVYLR